MITSNVEWEFSGPEDKKKRIDLSHQINSIFLEDKEKSKPLNEYQLLFSKRVNEMLAELREVTAACILFETSDNDDETVFNYNFYGSVNTNIGLLSRGKDTLLRGISDN